MNNRLIIFLAFVAIAVALMPRKEAYAETRGNAGYVPPKTIKLDDEGADLQGFDEVDDFKVTPDLVNKIVMATNEAIGKRTGLDTYIIQTHALKKYIGKGSGEPMYQAMFMVSSRTGFAYGFNVVSEIDGAMRVTALRTQPLGAQAPSNVAPFLSTGAGKEFVDYRLVEQMTPTEPQLLEAKRQLDRIESKRA